MDKKLRRVGNLFQLLVSYPNLYSAFKKAFRGTNKSREVTKFYFNAEKELLLLKTELIENTYFPGRYRYFNIYEPKERKIAVAPFRDRVVHHAIVNILEPIYEKCFIYDSYATRKGKGTFPAIKRAQSFLRKSGFYLKMDIFKYFESVDRKTLLTILERKIKDNELLLLLEKIIWNPTYEDKGLPIGNLTSQFFANVYLNNLDHYIKEKLKRKYYVRYMDDMVLFSNSKIELKNDLKLIDTFLREKLKLKIKEKATMLNKQIHGLSFLGVRIFPSMIRIQRKHLKKSLGKIKNKEKAYCLGEISDDELVMSVQSIVSYLSQFNTLKLMQKVIG